MADFDIVLLAERISALQYLTTLILKQRYVMQCSLRISTLSDTAHSD
jgi:hypothetical protein